MSLIIANAEDSDNGEGEQGARNNEAQSLSRRNDHPSALLHLRQGHWQQVGDLLESLAS